MTDTIQQLIDKAISLEDAGHIKSHKFKPSLFGRCYRLQYWARKGEKESNPVDSRQKRVFKAGKLFHDFVQGLLGGEIEVLVENNDVKGYADLVRENEVVDIKSQHSRAFWWMSKKNMDIRKEKYPNWLQVGYYARELKKPFMRLVFVSKDDLCINEYVQPLDDYWLEAIEDELHCLRYHWDKQGLPAADPRCFINKDGKSKECGYCSWLKLCNKIEGHTDSKAEAELCVGQP